MKSAAVKHEIMSYCEGKKLQWKSEMELIEDRLYLREEMKWDLQCYKHENECTYCWGENYMKILDGSTVSIVKTHYIFV